MVENPGVVAPVGDINSAGTRLLADVAQNLAPRWSEVETALGDAGIGFLWGCTVSTRSDPGFSTAS